MAPYGRFERVGPNSFGLPLTIPQRVSVSHRTIAIDAFPVIGDYNWCAADTNQRPIMNDDEYWMAVALDQARAAQSEGEVPVGAAIVRGDSLLATGRNGPIGACDPTAHAEIAALRAAGMAAQNYRLPDCTLYVTLEPCQMCAGAIVHARLQRLVFAADDPRAGAVRSVAACLDWPWLNHRTSWVGGVSAAEARDLLRQFFRQRRAQGSGSAQQRTDSS